VNSSDIQHEDDQWLAQLVGRNESSDAMTVALRKSMLERHQIELGEQPPMDELALNKLLQRCWDEGLMEEKSESSSVSWWSGLGWMPAFTAVAVLCLLLVLNVTSFNQSSNKSDDPIYRGMTDKQMIVKIVSEPMQQALALQKALQDVAVPNVQLYQLNDDWVISVKMIEPVTKDVRAVLQSNKLEVNQQGMLKVMFSASNKP